MRLSMDKDDPGYDPGYDPARGIHAKVLLDGVEVKNCLTADEEKGEVVVLRLDLQPGGEASPPRETRRGKVRIILFMPSG
jgi:hypothetical protein